VFVIDLEEDAAAFDAAWQLLDSAERVAAERYVVAAARTRFVLRRAARRAVVAQRLGCAPETVRFAAGAFGAPHIVGAPALHVSTSSTHGCGLIALHDTPVGVDIEQVRPIPEALSIARSFLAPAEASALACAAESERGLMFLRLWTVKEAVVKALGRGLSLRLDRFCVEDLDAPKIGWNDGENDDAAWRFFTFVPAPGYVAALALRAP
jgi:4'-phosphopantetheinyl transferase